MSLQGPLLVVAEQSGSPLIDLLRDAGAFPVVETNWTDAPTAFVAVKPNAVVIAEPGPPPSETGARMMCLQIATAQGPIVPVIALAHGDLDAAIPIAIPLDGDLPEERLLTRLRAALRVRGLHEAVLRRIENYGAAGGVLPPLPMGDALADATVLVVGRGGNDSPYLRAWSLRARAIVTPSLDIAAQHLAARDIDGLIVTPGFAPKQTEQFLSGLAGDPALRDIPVALPGGALPDYAIDMSNVDPVADDPSRIVAAMVPRLRLRALEARFHRMLKTLETEGLYDADTGLMAQPAFWNELTRAMGDANRQSQGLAISRIMLEPTASGRVSIDAGRLAARMIRANDFAGRDDNGALLVAMTQTNFHEAHVVARRIAGALKNALAAQGHGELTADVTLATMRANDSIESLMARVTGGQTVAAE